MDIETYIHGTDVLGAAGFDLSFIADTVAKVAERGYGEYQNREKAKEDAAEGEKRALAITVADADLARAYLALDVATELKDEGKITAARALVDVAEEAVRDAARDLPKAAADKRLAAMKAAIKKAADAVAAKPADKVAVASLRAWKRVADGGAQALAMKNAASAALVPVNMPLAVRLSEFLNKERAGVPTWGWLGGAALTAVGILLYRRSGR